MISNDGGNRIALAVGDSITAGAPGGFGGYRAPLFAANPGLIYKGRNFSVGYHEGYGGFTIEQISAEVLPFVDYYAPSMITLIAGTNNIAASETAAAVFAKLQTLATDLKAKASVALVLVGTIPHYQAFLAVQTAYNALILGWAPPAGISVHDVTSTLIYPTDFADAVHPNTAGYNKMAALWSPAVAVFL